MNWNYRLILHDDLKLDQRWIGLHEVYYDEKGNPTTWTESAVSFGCDEAEGAAGIRDGLTKALAGAGQPVLVESELLAAVAARASSAA